MKQQFKQAYRAYRMLGNNPDWLSFDKRMEGISLQASIYAGRAFINRF